MGIGVRKCYLWLAREIDWKGTYGDFLVLAGDSMGINIVKIHQTKHLICIHFTVCKLYLNKRKGWRGRNLYRKWKTNHSTGNSNLHSGKFSPHLEEPERHLFGLELDTHRCLHQQLIPPQRAAATGWFLNLGRELLMHAIFRQWEVVCAISFLYHID